MQRKIAICIAKISCLLAPCAGWAAEPSDAVRESAERLNWVRRHAQVATVLTDQLAKFREQASRSASAIRPVLLRHNVKNENLFMIELEPSKHYALRYYEYDGNNFLDDMQLLEQEVLYRQWTDKVDSCLADGWSDVDSVFFTAGQLRPSVAEERVKRIGQVVGLRPEMAEPYKLLHAHTWPGVLAAIREGNVRNYSIFLAPIDSKLYLFAYLEYIGNNFGSDMARIDSDPETKAWIKFTDEGCQLPISTRKQGEWWARMKRLSVEESSTNNQ